MNIDFMILSKRSCFDFSHHTNKLDGITPVLTDSFCANTIPLENAPLCQSSTQTYEYSNLSSYHTFLQLSYRDISTEVEEVTNIWMGVPPPPSSCPLLSNCDVKSTMEPQTETGRGFVKTIIHHFVMKSISHWT